jgi:SAM-dependent methyltransferase
MTKTEIDIIHDRKFTEGEASKIDTLPWYNDPQIDEAIRSCILVSPKKILLDLCCGTATIAVKTRDLISGYIGIDNSSAMVQKARANIIDHSFDTANYSTTCCDVFDYLETLTPPVHACSVLIKNSLQFVDAERLSILLQQRLSGSTLMVVQTVRHTKRGEDNLYKHLLTDLDFTKRITRYLSYEDVVRCFGKVLSHTFTSQTIDQFIQADAWLRYHGVDEWKIVDVLSRLTSISDEDARRFGVVRAYSGVFLQRRQMIISGLIAP